MNDSADYGSYGVYLYVPVIHEGIRRWLLKHFDAQFIALVGPNTLSERRSIVKDIRRMPVDDVAVALRALQLTRNLRVMEFEELSSLETEIVSLVMPKDELMLEAAAHLPDSVRPVFESVFLRWDHGNVTVAQPLAVSQRPTISLSNIWAGLDELVSWSPDWWRQVASALIVNDEVAVSAYNRPLPNEEAVLMRGDPRALFNKGVHIELSSYLHAEAHVIAEAARRGIATEGGDMYVTTFPCPVCSKLLAATGIARLFYRDGYSMLDGEEVLLGAGIEILQVK